MRSVYTLFVTTTEPRRFIHLRPVIALHPYRGRLYWRLPRATLRVLQAAILKFDIAPKSAYGKRKIPVAKGELFLP